MFMKKSTILTLVVYPVTSIYGFVVIPGGNRVYGNNVVPSTTTTTTMLDMAAKVGIFFGTSTGSTEEVADLIKAEFQEEADGPFDIETLDGPIKNHFEKYDSLVVGTPTWNTASDTERSGTGETILHV
jgi:hypothetical protein